MLASRFGLPTTLFIIALLFAQITPGGAFSVTNQSLDEIDPNLLLVTWFYTVDFNCHFSSLTLPTSQLLSMNHTSSYHSNVTSIIC